VYSVRICYGAYVAEITFEDLLAQIAKLRIALTVTSNFGKDPMKRAALAAYELRTSAATVAAAIAS
jgi:hypothetical protein